MRAALALSTRGRGRTSPNPNVGCLIFAGAQLVGRGWTQPGGRPHAEAMALAQAGAHARGATAYVTLEPCAHVSPRGACCADSLIAAGVARVVIGAIDPDPRTHGAGIAKLKAAGIAVESGLCADEARAAMAGFFSRQLHKRPHVTLKLATSLDGAIARADGESRWITGSAARAHGHLERARADLILVGRATWDQDAPQLDVRLPGLADRAPRRAVLTNRALDAEVEALAGPTAIFGLEAVDWLLIEGGAQAAAAFIAADLVDRLLLYRAPILIGGGRACLGDIGLGSLAAAHGRWQRRDTRELGSDRLEVYERLI